MWEKVIIIYDNHQKEARMYEIEYYEEDNGRKPVEEFVDSLDVKMRAKRMRGDWRMRNE